MIALGVPWWVLIAFIVVGGIALIGMIISILQISRPTGEFTISSSVSTNNVAEDMLYIKTWSSNNTDYTSNNAGSVIIENHANGDNGVSSTTTSNLDVGLAPSLKFIKAGGNTKDIEALDSDKNYRAGQISMYAYLDGNTNTPYNVANIYGTASKNSALVFNVLDDFRQESPLILDRTGAYINGEANVTGNVSVIGNITATGSITPATSSDERFKKNIEKYKGGLKVVKQLHPVTFEYDEKLGHGSQKNIGFMAQDVIKLVPEAVRICKRSDLNVEDFHMLLPDQLTFVLWNAVRTLAEKVETLEKQVVDA